MEKRNFTRRSFLGAMAAWPALGYAPKAHSAILIRLSGGLSHLDSFDPKPTAPPEIRGPFRAIRTSVPGVWFCEHLPRLAARARRLTVLRSLHSRETNHERASWLLNLQEAERIDPVASSPGGLKELERYGHSRLGLALLAARRRVERGSALIVVEQTWPKYDTHRAAFGPLKDHLLPELDVALSALLDELEERGLLDSTLVVAVGEFGRSPWINQQGGRDHHAGAWTALLAGGGLMGGRVIGATDRYGAEVTATPVRPEDLIRTVLALLGREPSPRDAARSGRIVPEVLAS